MLKENKEKINKSNSNFRLKLNQLGFILSIVVALFATAIFLVGIFVLPATTNNLLVSFICGMISLHGWILLIGLLLSKQIRKLQVSITEKKDINNVET